MTEPCPFCLGDIPSAATRCRHCAGDLTKPVDSPDLAGFWISGIVLVIIGVGLAALIGSDGAWVGFVIAGLGGLVLQIATIALGVSIGIRHRDESAWFKRHSNAESTTA